MPLYVLFLVRRTIVLLIVLLAIAIKNLIRYSTIKPVLILIIVFIYLLFPSMTMLKDGGSTLIWSPVYEVITWRQIDDYDENSEVIKGRRGTYYYLFPNNTKNFSDTLEDNN